MPIPKKTDMARFKAMNDLGLTPNAISIKTGYNPKTIRKYLSSEVYLDPDIQKMISVIKEKELADLYLLGAKARKRLHELFDEGKTKMIETTAAMDRVFQQRQLLSGGPTQNIYSLTAIVEAANKPEKKTEDPEDDKEKE